MMKPYWRCNGVGLEVTMSDTPRRLQVKFSLPSDPRYLCVVRGAIGALAAVIGWDESECRAISLTVEEDDVKISVRNVGAAKVVEVEGDVDLGTSPDLRRTLFEALPTVGRLALNLGAIRYIDSSGIATLIEVLKRSQHLRKEFVLF